MHILYEPLSYWTYKRFVLKHMRDHSLKNSSQLFIMQYWDLHYKVPWDMDLQCLNYHHYMYRYSILSFRKLFSETLCGKKSQCSKKIQWGFFPHQFGTVAGALSIGKNSNETGKLRNIHATTFSLNWLCFVCVSITVNFHRFFMNSPKER
jgi:hypothetical protein